jgi:predicted ATP-dependent serine protease
MMPTWNAMAAGIAMQPVPPELARVVSITCNDCESNEDARAWHFLGMQCSKCQSFNTVVDKILLTGEEAHEFLEMNAKIAAAQERAVAEGEMEQDPNRPRRRRVNRRRSAF